MDIYHGIMLDGLTPNNGLSNSFVESIYKIWPTHYRPNSPHLMIVLDPVIVVLTTPMRFLIVLPYRLWNLISSSSSFSIAPSYKQQRIGEEET